MQRPWCSKVCLHVGQELVDDEGALGQVDQMRAVVGIFARERRGRGEEAGVPAHDDRDIDAFQRRIVEIGAREGLGDEARRGRKARRMIEADEIVVDRLGDMDRAEPMAGFLRLLGDDAHRVGGIVAADVEERVDLVRLQDLEDLLAIFEVGLVAGRAERGGGRRGDRLEIGGRLLPEIDEIVVDDAAHAVQRAIDMADVGKPPRLERHAGQRLVDHRRRAASLGDEDLVRHGLQPPFGECGLGQTSARASGFRRRPRHAQAGGRCAAVRDDERGGSRARPAPLSCALDIRGPGHAYPRHQSQHHPLDDVKIGAAAKAAASPGVEVTTVNPEFGPASIEGYFDEAFSVPGLIEEIGKAPRRGRLRHRLFRRYRARGGAMRDPGASRWHRRSRVPHGEPDRGEIQRRDHAVPIDYSDRAQFGEIRASLPLRPRARRRGSGAGARRARLRRAAPHRTGDRAARSQRMAPKRSCSAAPA